jgi:hypothetical protein
MAVSAELWSRRPGYMFLAGTGGAYRMSPLTYEAGTRPGERKFHSQLKGGEVDKPFRCIKYL